MIYFKFDDTVLYLEYQLSEEFVVSLSIIVFIVKLSSVINRKSHLDCV